MRGPLHARGAARGAWRRVQLVSACAAGLALVAACSTTPSGSVAPTVAAVATSVAPTVAAAAPTVAAAATSVAPTVAAAAPTVAAVATSVAAAAPKPAPPSASPAASSAASGPVEHVKYATTAGSSTSAGVFIAQARGYFQEVGIDLEIVPFGGGADMISTIAASQVDVANTDAGAGLINAIARNVPIKFVADGARCIPGKCNSAFIIRKDLVDSGRFKDLPDLKGMNVNTGTPGSTLNGFTLRTLEKVGLTAADVKEQNVAFADVLPALNTKALDALFLIEPFTTLAVTQGLAVKWKDTSEILGPQQSTVIAYSPTFAAQHQDAGKRFMVAYLRGVRDFVDAFGQGQDQQQIISMLTTSTTLKDPAQWSTVPQWFDANGGILLDPMKANEQWYVDHGFIQTPVNLDTVWDPSYTDYAVSVLGKR